MLTRETLASSARRQIAVSTTSSGQVMYTVPDGRTFSGILTGTSVSVNGSVLTDLPDSNAPLPVTFLSGTVLANQSTNGATLIGVEQ
jgi:hypothetical protein